jgi:hypothetical protein
VPLAWALVYYTTRERERGGVGWGDCCVLTPGCVRLLVACLLLSPFRSEHGQGAGSTFFDADNLKGIANVPRMPPFTRDQDSDRDSIFPFFSTVIGELLAEATRVA